MDVRFWTVLVTTAMTEMGAQTRRLHFFRGTICRLGNIASAPGRGVALGDVPGRGVAG